MLKVRLDFKKRERESHLKRAEWIAHFYELSGCQLSEESFMPLLETQELKDRFYAKIRESINRQQISLESLSHLHRAIAGLGQSLSGVDLLLFGREDEWTGAVKLPAGLLFEKIESLWTLFGGEFPVVTCALTDGLCVEWVNYRSDGSFVKEGLYEIVSWGRLTFRLNCL